MKTLRTLVVGSIVVAIAAGTETASAFTIDLINGNTGTANGVIYNYFPAGSLSGLDPFLHLDTGTGAAEQGYNNNVGAPWETAAGPSTHDFQLQDVSSVSIGGTDYYQFLLDITQQGADPFLTLNNVQIFTRSTAIATAPESLAGLGTLRFNNDQVGGLGAANDVDVDLDYSRNGNIGFGDMFMYVSTSLFAGASGTDYVYFYSHFGNPGNDANGGSEKWANLVTAPVVPVPAAVWLFGSALGALGWLKGRTL